MIHIRPIIRTATALLVLASFVASGTAANAQKVSPTGGGQGPGVDQTRLDHGSPFWVFLTVGVGCVLLTLAVSQLVSHVRSSHGQRTASP